MKPSAVPQTSAVPETDPILEMAKTLPPMLLSSGLLELIGVSRGKLAELMLNHGFPQPVRFSSRMYKWCTIDVLRWMATTGRNLPARPSPMRGQKFGPRSAS
jgi:predicted DNA-binding transcriptional regulator AlpA